MSTTQLSGSVAISSTNAQTTLSIALAYPSVQIPTASYVTCTVTNSTPETVTQVTWRTTQVLNGVAVPLAVSQSVSIDPGDTGTVTLTLNVGLAANPTVQVTWAAPPTSGTLAVVAALSDLPASTPNWYDQQVTVGASGTALPAQAGTQWILTNDPDNPAGTTIWIGSHTGQHTPIPRGASLTVPVSQLSVVYARGSQSGLILDILGGV